jgi:hypothetical protein
VSGETCVKVCTVGGIKDGRRSGPGHLFTSRSSPMRSEWPSEWLCQEHQIVGWEMDAFDLCSVNGSRSRNGHDTSTAPIRKKKVQTWTEKKLDPLQVSEAQGPSYLLAVS